MSLGAKFSPPKETPCPPNPTATPVKKLATLLTDCGHLGFNLRPAENYKGWAEIFLIIFSLTAESSEGMIFMFDEGYLDGTNKTYFFLELGER